MFLAIVSTLLLLLLFLCSGAALYMGIFKANRPNTGLVRKVVSGVLSYGLSAVFWLGCYSYQQLGW
ncbi:MAG: hypothetical protein ACK5PS_03500 [Desulfopila sp.]